MKELIKKAGIERRIYTAGKNKSTLDPFVEEKEEDIVSNKQIKEAQKVLEKARMQDEKKEQFRLMAQFSNL